MTPLVGGKWTEKVLHNFGNGKDGRNPYAGLVLDAAGNLYGTTAGGGNYSSGIVYEPSPTGSGGWTETALHEFGNSRTDGQNPYAGLTFDAAGNLYGTTVDGGAYSRGTVFELMPKAGGGWTESVLHTFPNNTTDGGGPYAGPIFDGAGNLYGTTELNGAHNAGTVYKLTRAGGGNWTDTLLFSFYDEGDGGSPLAGVIFDASGHLYGTTLFSLGNSGGTVFEITP